MIDRRERSRFPEDIEVLRMPEKRKKRRLAGFRRVLLCLGLAALLSSSVIAAGSAMENIQAVNGSGNQNGDPSVDPVGHSEGYSAVLYDNTNGLPTSESNAIAETGDGFLWIASYSGLIRYDGNTFERIDSSTGVAGVRCLYTDRLDRLWIGTNDSGLVLMENGSFRHWDKTNGLKSDNVRIIAEDAGGTVYVASDGVNLVDPSMNLRSIGDPRAESVNLASLRVGPDGLVYALTDAGDIFTMRDGSIVDYYSHEDFRVSSAGCLMPDPDNPGWVYLECGNSLICYGKPEDGFRDAAFFDISPLAYVQQMEAIGDKIWICTRNGIGALDENGFHRMDSFPMNNSVGHVMTDYEGNLWFTSTRQGVMKVVPNRFLNLFDLYAIPEEVVNSTCMYNQRLFIATDTGLKVVDQHGLLDRLPLRSAVTASGRDLGAADLLELLDGCRIRSILRDSKGRLWISTWRTHGLLRYDRGDLTAFTVEDGLLSDTPRAVCEREDGSILVALTGGLNVIEGDRVTASYGAGDGITNSESLTVAEGFHGDILLGTDGGGMYIIGDGALTHLGKEEGLSSEIVMRLKRDKYRDVIWLVTSNSISYLTPDYRVATVRTFPYSNNFDLYQNSRDEMWILSSNGIYVVPTEDLLADRDLSPIHYGMANGLPCITILNIFIVSIFNEYTLYDGGMIAVAMILYTLQLYADFSGTMDIAIGIGEIFGVKIPENFRQPFFSKSISDFWTRWHITLGTWLRDYIYYPVSLSNVCKKITTKARKKIGNYYGPIIASSIALFAVWICNGIWHGSAWNYIFFGMYHFSIILSGKIFEPLFKKLTGALHINRKNYIYICFQIIRTTILVFIGELFFRANGLRDGFEMFYLMITDFSLESITSGRIFQIGIGRGDFIVLAIATVAIFVVSILKEKGINVRKEISKRNIIIRWAVYYAIILAIIIFGGYGDGYKPVDSMYAQF